MFDTVQYYLYVFLSSFLFCFTDCTSVYLIVRNITVTVAFIYSGGGGESFEAKRAVKWKEKRERKKNRSCVANSDVDDGTTSCTLFTCSVCGRVCHSVLGYSAKAEDVQETEHIVLFILLLEITVCI